MTPQEEVGEPVRNGLGEKREYCLKIPGGRGGCGLERTIIYLLLLLGDWVL